MKEFVRAPVPISVTNLFTRTEVNDTNGLPLIFLQSIKPLETQRSKERFLSLIQRTVKVTNLELICLINSWEWNRVPFRYGIWEPNCRNPNYFDFLGVAPWAIELPKKQPLQHLLTTFFPSCANISWTTSPILTSNVGKSMPRLALPPQFFFEILGLKGSE